MRIKIFTDTICGWCYIGQTRLINALKNFKNTTFNFEHAPFQLNPDMPKNGMKRQDYLKYKFGSIYSARPMNDSMVQEGQKENIKLIYIKLKLPQIQIFLIF